MAVDTFSKDWQSISFDSLLQAPISLMTSSRQEIWEQVSREMVGLPMSQPKAILLFLINIWASSMALQSIISVTLVGFWVVVVVGKGSKQQSSVLSKDSPTQLSVPHLSLPLQLVSLLQSPSPNWKKKKVGMTIICSHSGPLNHLDPSKDGNQITQIVQAWTIPQGGLPENKVKKHKRNKNALMNYKTHPAFYAITARISTITHCSCMWKKQDATW